MQRCKKWLDNYKKVKTAQDKKYPFLSLEIIKKYEKLAEEYGVSKVARGIETSKKTDKGFLPVIKSINKVSELIKTNERLLTIFSYTFNKHRTLNK